MGAKEKNDPATGDLDTIQLASLLQGALMGMLKNKSYLPNLPFAVEYVEIETDPQGGYLDRFVVVTGADKRIEVRVRPA